MALKIRHDGFTIIELLVVVLSLTTACSLLLPAIQGARESARRNSCSSNLMQVGLAVSGYHTTFKQFPVQLSGTSGSPVLGMDNDSRLSVFVALMPFLDQTSWFEWSNHALSKQYNSIPDPTDPVSMTKLIGNAKGDDTASNEYWPSGGPEPFERKYPPWSCMIPPLRCPSDPGFGPPAFGRTNYAISLGDGIRTASSGPFRSVNGQMVHDVELARQTDIAMRGVFVPRMMTRYTHVTDGLSQTVMLGEIATDLGDRDWVTCPGIASTMEEPNDLIFAPDLARHRNVIDAQRPRFWRPSPTPSWATPDQPSTIQVDSSMSRGYRFADGMPIYTAFNTILPPNSELVLSNDTDASDGIFPASSRHWGGAQACMADGRVLFVSNSIDAGSASAPTVYATHTKNPDESGHRPESPYGVWGAMGTRSASELHRSVE